MTPAQCRAARALLDWKQIDLADRAELKSHMPVFYYEKHGSGVYGEGPYRSCRFVSQDAVNKMKAAFDKAGIEFIGDTGVNLRRREK